MLPVGDFTTPSRRGFVTGLFALANLLAFFVPQFTATSCEQLVLLYRFAAIPQEITTLTPLSVSELSALLGDCARPGITKNIPASVVTSFFLHGSALHLFGNLLFLVVFGNDVEARLGHLRFVLFAVAGGSVATGAHVLLQPSSSIPLVGASGVIAAILGAYLLCFPRSRILTLVPFPMYLVTWLIPGLRTVRFLFVAALVTMPAWLVLSGWFVLQVAEARAPTDDVVAYEAHVAGFAAGIVLVLALDRVRRRAGRTPFHPPRGAPSRPPDDPPSARAGGRRR